MKRLIPPLLLLMVSSCISTEKAADKATKDEAAAKYTNALIKAKHPLVSASDCAEWYPIKETVITKRDTIRKEVTIPGDSIPCPPVTDTKTGKVYVPKVKCPDVSYFQEQITELTEKTQESTAKVETANLTINKVKAELLAEKAAHLLTMEERDKYKKQRNQAYIGLLVLGIFLAGLFYLGVIR